MYIRLFSMIFLFAACNNMSTSSTTRLSLSDSLDIARKSDSMAQAIIKNVLFDTIGVSTAPVRVISAKLVTREYSNYKDIWLSWKNVGSKKIAAIRFRWYGTNAFGEPVDMGTPSIHEGFGGGFSDRTLSPGRTDDGTWS